MENTYGTFIINPKQELLICQPYGTKGINNWSIPKGKSEKDETPIQAAIRECYEESGFDLKPYKKSMKEMGSKTYKTKKKRLHGFYLQLNEHINIKCFYCDCKILNREYPEIISFEWCPIQKSLSRIHEAQSKLLKEYLENKHD